jgi:hypothetical protein
MPMSEMQNSFNIIKRLYILTIYYDNISFIIIISNSRIIRMNILAIIIALALITAEISFVNFTFAVELIPLNSTNSTLNEGLPIFYDCIDEAVAQSVNVQEDDYFKEEPTKNEVVKCYYKVLIESNGLGNSDVQNNMTEDAEQPLTSQLPLSQDRLEGETQVAPSVPFFQ